MKYFVLCLLIIVTWLVAYAAVAGQNAVRAQAAGKPAGGVSLLPGLLLLPIVFTAGALVLDRVRPNLGSTLVGPGHLLLLLYSLASATISTLKLRRNRPPN